MNKEWIFDFYKGWDWKSFFSLGISTFTLNDFVSVSFQILGGHISFEWRVE